MADLAGSQVEKYQIIRKLAEGGFAEVYLGEHIFTKRSAAIKVLKETIKTGSKEEVGFKQEAITIAKLEHQHIIPLFDCGFTPDSRPYITMLLCETNLADRIRGNILSLEQVLEYAVPIAQALFHAHEHGIVHRDIKPQNVLISHIGTLLLSDFGIAVKSTTSQAPLRSVVGTAPYMAPEQFSGHACRATDQYALGIMIYEWLCGKKPFVGNHDLNKVMISYGHLHNNVVVPSFASKGITAVDPDIEQAVRRALAKNPDDRFKTVLDFVGALEDVRTRLIRQAQEAREKAQQQEAEERRRRQQEYINQLQEQIQQEKNYSVKVEEALTQEQKTKRLVENNNQELQQQLNELKVAFQNSVQQVETLTKQKADLEKQVQTVRMGIPIEPSQTSDCATISSFSTDVSKELDSGSTDLLREVVTLCLQLGRNQDAARYQILIVRHYVNTEQIKEAVAALKQLITIDRSNYEAYDLLGQAYQSVGEYEMASRVYRSLAKINPGSSIAHERLAALQEVCTAKAKPTHRQERKQVLDEQTIYISPDNDLVAVRERLEQIPTQRLTLVIPPETRLRSHVAWKLLYARARELGKDVVIVSSDPQVRSVAHAVKFKVAHSLPSIC